MKGGSDGQGLRPKDIMEMTGPELVLIGTEDGERTYSGVAGMSDEEIEEYRVWYLALTPRERLKHAREGTL